MIGIRAICANLGLTLLSVVVGFAIVEAGLRIFTPYPNNQPRANQIPDAVLGYRLAPGNFEVNSSGFRSPELSQPLNLAAIGDSHTFGVNATLSQTWPANLAKRHDWSYYNFGLPGFNIVEYYLLLDLAFETRPSIVVLAIYPFNDFESFCKTFRAREKALVASGLQDSGRFCEHEPPSGADPLGSVGDLATTSFLRDWLSRRSTWSPKKMWGRDDVFRVALHGIEASFAIPERSAYLARLKSQKHVESEALMFARDVLRKLNANRNVSRVLVAIIPSKEMVYEASEVATMPSVVDELVEYETALSRSIEAIAAEEMVPICNVLPTLAEQLKRGQRTYPQYDNSHPLSSGYEAYAAAIDRCIAERFDNLAPRRRETVESRAEHQQQLYIPRL